MLAPYSTPQVGFVTLFPHVDAGHDVAVALHRIGARPNAVQKALGYGMIVSTGDRVVIHADNDEKARAVAAKEAMSRPVVLVKAVARGRTTLYQRMERIELMPVWQATNLDDVFLVSPNGVLVEKAANMYDAVDFKAVSKKMIGQLRWADRKYIKPQLDKMLEQLDIDWTKMSRVQIRDAFRRADRFMRSVATDKVLPIWTEKVNITLKVVANGVRKQIKNNFLPRIGMSYTRDEVLALERVGEQQGWFMRDYQKTISTGLTERGRKIVQDGLSKGLGRKEIGKRLWEQLPGMWEGMGKRYADVVAANAVSRARSWAELVSYQSAGVEMLEAQAVLDERTTDTCVSRDTIVSTISGGVEIRLIKTGDYVITGSGKTRAVNGVKKTRGAKLYLISLSSGRTIKATENHPFLTSNGWKKVMGLKTGDKVAKKRTTKSIRGFIDGEKSTEDENREGVLDWKDYVEIADGFDEVKSVTQLPGNHTVYNLEIDDDPTFVASGIIVHNCRFLDGQIIEVNACMDLAQQATSVSKPEDIYRVSPFMRTVTEDGRRYIETTTGTRLAEMVRSGAGRVNDRGEFRAFISGRQLPHAHVGMPPYHFSCRTYTVPRVESFQVPRSYQVRAGPSRPETPIVTPPRRSSPPVRPPGAPSGLFAVPPSPKQGFKVSPQRPLTQYQSGTATRPAPMGDPLDLDDLVVPQSFFLPPSAGPLGRNPNNWAVFRPFTRHRAGLRELEAGEWKTIGKGWMDEILSVGEDAFLLANRNTMIQMGTTDPLGPQMIAGIASNPAMAGRDVVFRVVPKTSVEQYIRIYRPHANRQAINTAVTNLRKGTWTDAQAEKWLAQAQRDGWIRIGKRFDDVTVPYVDRTGTLPVTPKKKPLPAGTPKPPLPDPVVPPPEPPEPPVQVPSGQMGAGLKDRVVTSRVYASRPAQKQMVDSTWDGTYGLRQTMTVDGQKITPGKWAKVHTDGKYSSSLKISDIKLADSDHVVTLYNPAEMGEYHSKIMFSRMVRSEMERGYVGVREWIVHDVRGQTLFARFDGAAASRVGRDRVNELLESIISGTDTAKARALKQLRSGGVAEMTSELKKFYPKSRIDWSRGNLVPGVEIEKQAVKRVTQVKKEIDDALSVARAASNRPLSKKDIGGVIQDVLKRGASGQRGSLYLSGSNPVKATKNVTGRTRQDILSTSKRAIEGKYLVDEQKLVDKLFDDALKDAGDGLMMAMQTKKMPVVVTRVNATRSYHVRGRGVGSHGNPSVIALQKSSSLEVGYTRRGKRPDYVRSLAREDSRHEVQHHIDMIGMNGSASRAIRNRQVIDGKPIDIYGNGK